MKYIRECPDCGRNLRFPLDRGKIKIKCRCGYTALIDPDDTALYKTGKFDLAENNKPSGRKFTVSPSFKNLFKTGTIIKKFYEFKYTLQNLKHMPDREKFRFLILILLPVILLIVLLFFSLK